MVDNRRQQLDEQYEEIRFSRLMDDYANDEGARLLQEFEQAQVNGDLPDIPAELDEKCRQLIDKSFSKQDRKAQATRIYKLAVKAAVVMLVLLGLSTITVMSVDALRIPVLNFFLRDNKRYSSLTTSEQNENTLIQEEITTKMLGIPIPDGYELVLQDFGDDGSVILCYQDEKNHIIKFQSTPSSQAINIDTEGIEVTEMEINCHDAVFIDKDGFRLVWIDLESEMIFELKATGLDINIFWELAYALAE